MNLSPILIACVGNIFLSDDAFGVEVARRFDRRVLPKGVDVVDFGIRGIDLTYALLEPYEAVILVDAVPRGGPPGTLYVIEPEREMFDDSNTTGSLPEPHNLDPAKVLRLARAMGSTVQRILLVGCEPELPPADEDFRMEMSEPVRAAVDVAIPLIESLVTKIRENGSH
jgi:hydrogenase maturation protease